MRTTKGEFAGYCRKRGANEKGSRVLDEAVTNLKTKTGKRFIDISRARREIECIVTSKPAPGTG